MTIDSKRNFNVASSNPASAKKTATDAAPSTSFDDALKAAKPQPAEKADQPEKQKPVDSKKTAASSKKAAVQKKQPKDAREVDETDASRETTATDATKTQDNTDSPDDTEVTTDADCETPEVKDKNPATQAKADSVEISDLATAAAAQTQTAPQQVDAAEDPAVDSEVVEQPVAKGNPQAAKVATQPNPQTKDVSADQTAVDQTGKQSTQAAVTPLQPQDQTESDLTVEATQAKKTDDAKAVEQKTAGDVQSAPAAPADAQATANVSESLAPQASPAHTTGQIAAPKLADSQQQPSHVAATPDVRFAQDNHPQIVSSIRGELLPDGGKMTLKLDPPELGALQVQLHMQDGTVTATFQTNNDEATRMLSHSLSSLKTALESQGINVDKLQVQQAPKDQQTGTNHDPREQNQSGWDNQSARQEQQRREMLQRMWRKLSGAEDPLDMVA